MSEYVLVLFYSSGGHTQQMAESIAKGIESAGIEARIRTVPRISAQTEKTQHEIPDEGYLFASKDDLAHCSALVMGSPTRFGNMAAPLKYFLDQTSDLWLSGALVNKPAAVFTSSSTLHGGQESTCLSMQLPLLHHGMIIVGIPFTATGMHINEQFTKYEGGSPYGAGMISHKENLSKNEDSLCHALGKRVALIAKKLTC
ncbi:NAD(P)H:quinone oxidoreductase [Marinicellulosiphila megalodicopiae]|uniref:NAD(P)H:quinone oxidoreductase n=1 Tax=Marinicellulosiphila megalodicopiae TaxID=2724896 RepID=UPI003BAF0370